MGDSAACLAKWTSKADIEIQMYYFDERKETVRAKARFSL